MTRYYYDDALQAAWMSQEHGIKILSTKFGELSKEHSGVEICYWEGECVIEAPYYVDEDSERLLQPQVGDLVQLLGGSSTNQCYHIGSFIEYPYKCADSLPPRKLDCFVPSMIECGMDYLDSNHELTLDKQISGFKIIQRNGAAFFTPKVEEV